MRRFPTCPTWLCVAVLLGDPVWVSAGQMTGFGLPAMFDERILFNSRVASAGSSSAVPEKITFHDDSFDHPVSNGSFASTVIVTTEAGTRPSIEVVGKLMRSNPDNNDAAPFQVSGDGAISYSFLVQALTPLALPVPVQITYSGEATAVANGASAAASASAAILLSGSAESPFGLERLDRVQVLAPGGSGTMGGTVVRHFDPGDIATISLGAGAGGNVRNTGRILFSARVDPLIQIDPAFPDRDKFAIVFNTPFVTSPSAATPEPSTLLLASIGVLVGCAWRYRTIA